ncbi:MAG: F0F1 ATP synthase subunit gamma [Arsenophonus endosymbiont of Ceratovacuna japonica]
MSNIKEIYSKINSVQNTQKITKAMEMVAASKIRKIQERIINSNPYIKTIYRLINNLAFSNLEYKNSYFIERDIKNIGYLIISTERGLCGNLNINLFKKILTEIKIWKNKGAKIHLALIGSKAVLFFNSFNIIASIIKIGDNPSISNIIKLTKIILEEYNKKRLDKIYIITNRFINSITQVPTIIQLLPIINKDHIILKNKFRDYLYETDLKTLLNTLLYNYIKSQIYHNIIENLVSEQAARIIAMKSASDNSGNLIKELQLIYNKTRQANITQELVEIVSGVTVV